MTIPERVTVVRENLSLLPRHNQEFAKSLVLFFDQHGRLSTKQALLASEFVRKIERALKKKAQSSQTAP